MLINPVAGLNAGLLPGLLILALAASPAAAQPVNPSISASPARPVLGADTRVMLTVEAPEGATDVRVFATRGQVEELTTLGPGKLQAVYVPPVERFPQLAVLVVQATTPAGLVQGWRVLPLLGQGIANVKTRPHAPVTLTVGATHFGPVVADAQGRARIPIIVPPGGEARHGEKRVELNLPAVGTAFAVVDRRSAPCDVATEAWVYYFAVEADGTARKATRLGLKVDRGEAEPATLLAPGVFAARWRVPPGQPGQGHLSATLDGELLPSIDVAIDFTTGLASRFELITSSEVVGATEGFELDVEVRSTDAVDNPARAQLEVDSGLGLVPLTERSLGRYGARLAVGPAFQSRTELLLRAFVEGRAEPVASRTIRLSPAAAARIELSPSEVVVSPDGRQALTFQLAVSDRFGNPVNEPAPVLTWAGAQPNVEARGPGRFEAKLVPAPVDEGREATLIARAGEANTSARVRLQPRWNRLSLGARAGMFSNARDVLAPSLGADAAGWLGPFALTLALNFLSFGSPRSELAPEFSGTTQVLSTTLGLAWRFFRRAPWALWADASAGVAGVTNTSALGSAPVLQESRAVFTGRLSLSAGYRLGPGLVSLGLAFSYLHDPALHSLRGALVGAGLEGGYRLELF